MNLDVFDVNGFGYFRYVTYCFYETPIAGKSCRIFKIIKKPYNYD